jgi:hypothetical protein
MPQLLTSVLVIYIVPAFLPAIPFIYIALRVRDLRGDNPDPQLGIKTVYHFFATVGILLVLSGINLIIMDMLDGVFDDKAPAQNQPFQPAQPPDDDEFFNSVKRTGMGMIISGSVFAAIFFLLVASKTNDRSFPNAGRAFAGLLLAISGTTVVTSATLFMITILQKEPEKSIFEWTTSAFLVWFPTMLVQVVRLRR